MKNPEICFFPLDGTLFTVGLFVLGGVGVPRELMNNRFFEDREEFHFCVLLVQLMVTKEVMISQVPLKKVKGYSLLECHSSKITFRIFFSLSPVSSWLESVAVIRSLLYLKKIVLWGLKRFLSD